MPIYTDIRKAAPDDTSHLLLSKVVPNMKMTSISNGETHMLHGILAKNTSKMPLVLFFYEAYCGGCFMGAKEMETMATELLLHVRFIAVNMSNQQIDVFQNHAKLKNMEHYGLKIDNKLEEFLGKFGITKIPHKMLVTPDGYVQHNGVGDVEPILRGLLRNKKTFRKKGTEKRDLLRGDSIDNGRPDSKASSTSSTTGGVYSRGTTPVTPGTPTGRHRPGSSALPLLSASMAEAARPSLSSSKHSSISMAVRATKQITTRRSKEKKMATEQESEAKVALTSQEMAKRVVRSKKASIGEGGSRRQSQVMAPRLLGHRHKPQEQNKVGSEGRRDSNRSEESMESRGYNADDLDLTREQVAEKARYLKGAKIIS